MYFPIVALALSVFLLGCASKPSVININEGALNYSGESPLVGGISLKNGRLKFLIQSGDGQTLLSGDINPDSSDLQIGMDNNPPLSITDNNGMGQAF